MAFDTEVLTIHSDTGDGSIIFTDSSSYAHTITRNFVAGTLAHSTAQQQVGASSLFSNPDGPGCAVNWLSIPDAPEFNLSSTDFSIKQYIRGSTALGDCTQESYSIGQGDGTNANSSFRMGVSNSGHVILASVFSGATEYTLYGTTYFNGNQWYLVELVRVGNTLSLKVDTVTEDTVDLSGVIINDSSADLSIFRDGDVNDDFFFGYIDEVLFVNSEPSEGSLAEIVSGFGFGTDVEADSNSSMDISSDIGLGVSVDAKPTPSLSINASVGLDSTAEFLVPGVYTEAIIGFGSEVRIDTKRIDEISAGLGLGVDLVAESIKSYSIESGIGLASSIDINIPQSYSIVTRLGLGSTLEVEKVIGSNILSGIGLGVELSTFNEVDLEIDVAIGLGSLTYMKSTDATCSIPTHNSTRWS